MGETTARRTIGLAVHPPGGLFDVFELSLFAFVGNRERGALDTRVGNYLSDLIEKRIRAIFPKPLFEVGIDLEVPTIKPTDMLVDVKRIPAAFILVENEILQPARSSVGIVEQNVFVQFVRRLNHRLDLAGLISISVERAPKSMR
ncbi:hypothetical protein [Pseudomonas fluorescens]|uniref:hypothetical protein n=1 Tax=Pseudomonas fluorescens TaxID=294 RepID=UPI001300CA37|nr:hypothetical protein [Pseudomonas fluorescens]